MIAFKGFEAFDVSTWRDGILTIWTTAASSLKQQVKRTGTHTAVAAAVMVGIATAGADVIAAPVDGTNAWMSSGASAHPKSAMVSEVPHGYWSQLMTQMSGWSAATEDAGDEPSF